MERTRESLRQEVHLILGLRLTYDRPTISQLRTAAIFAIVGQYIISYKMCGYYNGSSVYKISYA